MEFPFSQACANNQDPILQQLKKNEICGDVLEMGHGTGQHALYFASRLNVTWYASDLNQNHWMLNQRELPKNIVPNISLEIGKRSMFEQVHRKFDFVFTANTLHIMSEKNAFLFCQQVQQILKPQAKVLIYGPFKIDGQFTSESNAHFDHHLKTQNPHMGIRDLEKISEQLQPLKLISNTNMPANNQFLVYGK